ncbi:MAG: macrocin O-methyltransferase [Crenarchaeota archaeon]|nr:MAG: macrocin O-methyltransferase [Thermoproteota archaeon]RDJ33349.1 MAG: macrocin O-methyltransferase [Thermoproteota archaeon]RDJ36147.1 MAG: macrocin O-methyltransferase [Thermoproteota archaeon]RDJ38779.1 MAG: macrocin O-methyltransferase [Thermoproteota archaeon]
MKNLIKKSVRKVAQSAGYDIIQGKASEFPPDFNEEHVSIIKLVRPYTMTSNERIFTLIESVKYIVNNKIPGDIVECGVWKGGSMMTVAKTLLNLNKIEKDLYLFDTFEGMPEPSSDDISFSEVPASKEFEKTKISQDSSEWCRATLDDVKRAIFSTKYPQEKFHLIKGKVEDTIPSNAPNKISLLRLDTDWYQSTKHELIHLFPRLTKNGVLIIDDYGYWQGARKAVDEYFSENNISILLNRIDETGRVAIRQ